MADDGYDQKEMFNKNETALFKKRMPNKTCISNKQEILALRQQKAELHFSFVLTSQEIVWLNRLCSTDLEIIVLCKLKTRKTYQYFGVQTGKRGLQVSFSVTGLEIVLFLKAKLI